MSTELQLLIEQAKKVVMSAEELEAQRISFAYGNTKFENDDITRETVEQASSQLKGTSGATVKLPG